MESRITELRIICHCALCFFQTNFSCQNFPISLWQYLESFHSNFPVLSGNNKKTSFQHLVSGEGTALDERSDETISPGKGWHGPRHSTCQGGSEVIREWEALFLPTSLRLPLQWWLEEEAGAIAQRRRNGTGSSALRFYRNREFGAGYATAWHQWEGTNPFQSWRKTMENDILTDLGVFD